MKTFFPLSFLMLCSLSLVYSQSQENVYGNMIVNFIRGTQWPTANSDQMYKVGIYSYSPLADELRTLSSNVRINGKKISVIELSEPSGASTCHVVFIPAFKSRSLAAIISATKGSPVLIMTNKSDLAKQGSCVNFVFVEGKLKFELNQNALDQRKLKMSASLKGLGIIVGP